MLGGSKGNVLAYLLLPCYVINTADGDGVNQVDVYCGISYQDDWEVSIKIQLLVHIIKMSGIVSQFTHLDVSIFRVTITA